MVTVHPSSVTIFSVDDPSGMSLPSTITATIRHVPRYGLAPGLGASAHANLLSASVLNAKKKINIDVAIDVRIMIPFVSSA